MKYKKTKMSRYIRTAFTIFIAIGIVMNLNSCSSLRNSIKAQKERKYFEQFYSTDVNELSVYDYKTMYLYGLVSRHSVMKEFSSNLISLYSYDEVFPVELIKPIDADRIFVVYKLERDDMKTLIYLVFERTDSDFYDKIGVDDEDYFKTWETTGEFYFVAEKNSYSDYANVNIGTPASEVAQIDSSVFFDSKYILLPTTSICFISYRILTDGILLIEFEAPINKETNEISPFSEFSVKSKTFYPYDGDECPDKVTIMEYADLIEYMD